VVGSSVVDLLLYNEPAMNIIQKFEVLSMEHSDHMPIRVGLKTNTKHTKHIPQLTKEKYKFPTEPLVVQSLKENLDAKLSVIDLTADINVIGDALNSAVFNTCEEMEIIQVPKQIVHKPRWFDLDCKKLKLLMNSSLSAFRRNKVHEYSDQLQAKYQVAKKSYEAETKKKSEDQKIEIELKLSDHRVSKSFWSTFNNLNFKEKIANTISNSSWSNHNSNVFKVTSTYNPITIEIPSEYKPDPILDSDFNVFEVKLALNRLQSKKAPR